MHAECRKYPVIVGNSPANPPTRETAHWASLVVTDSGRPALRCVCALQAETQSRFRSPGRGSTTRIQRCRTVPPTFDVSLGRVTGQAARGEDGGVTLCRKQTLTRPVDGARAIHRSVRGARLLAIARACHSAAASLRIISGRPEQVHPGFFSPGRVRQRPGLDFTKAIARAIVPRAGHPWLAQPLTYSEVP